MPVDDGNGESVIAFAADGLNHCCGDAPLACKYFVESPHTLHALIAGLIINHRAAADDVIGEDETAAPRQLQRPFKIGRRVLFIGINKTKSNGAYPSEAICGRVSNAFPTRTSTLSDRFARAIFARATAACFGLYSKVTSLPSAGRARPSQIVLYPPSVPISKIERA
jgi:hypothetical protein